MLSNTIFEEKLPVSSLDLPLTLISLETWILIKLSGRDVIQYLHNQLTCDVKNLKKNQYSFSAHCNDKGKMISNMYVFHFENHKMAFIEPLSICEKQILVMKKYAVFSDVVITPDYNSTIIGVAGLNARKYLSVFFKILPNQINTVVHHQDITLLYFSLPTERFLLIITNTSVLTSLLNQSKVLPVQYNNHYQWVALDIEAGYPYISAKISEFFLPQAANMDILEGVSFNKGCYLGQELIARIQHRKLNKQSLYKLIGHLDYKHIQLPTPGDHIELQINNQYWKDIGMVIQSCKIQTNNIWIQAILKKSIVKKNGRLRIQRSQFYNNFSFYIIEK